ncbi:unnamed protein product [Ambrosiozyma monospora]|uniref:Unnamed protein product n=1 Tax=Ambrosiozyma monospora TaxID=43982 RepID=A0ACB5TFL9_AMBMO|nr:unnamed protein product [Ambrosiozyma monospora]
MAVSDKSSATSEQLHFTTNYFENSSTEQIANDLQSLKGFGPWTTSMFLMFALERLDVFEIGDLGIRRGFSYYIKERPDLVSEVSQLFNDGVLQRTANGRKKKFSDKYVTDFDLVEAIADQFKPYRTLFMLILWRISDTSVEAMGKR